MGKQVIHDTDRVKVDDFTWRVQCVQCGTRFESRRSDASFCSAKCRVAYSREIKQFQRDLLNAEYAVQKLLDRPLRSDKSPHYEVLTRLGKKIARALYNVEA